jgi:hypothetical protein
MVETCFIREWGGQGKVFSWDYSGHLNSESDYHETTSGFFKKFLFSKKLIVYKREGDWFLYVLGKEVPIQNIQKVRVENLGIMSKLTLVLGGKKHSFFELTPFDLFARKFDPTYDKLDSELVFGNWLVNLYQKEKK